MASLHLYQWVGLVPPRGARRHPTGAVHRGPFPVPVCGHVVVNREKRKGGWPSGKEESAFPGVSQELPFPFLVFWAMHLRNGNAQRRVPVSFSNLYVLEKVLWNSVSSFFWKSTPPSILN